MQSGSYLLASEELIQIHNGASQDDSSCAFDQECGRSFFCSGDFRGVFKLRFDQPALLVMEVEQSVGLRRGRNAPKANRERAPNLFPGIVRVFRGQTFPQRLRALEENAVIKQR